MAPSANTARIGCYVLDTKLPSTKTFEVWQSRRDDVGSGVGRFVVKRLLPELAENPRLVEQYAQRGERAKRLCHEGIVRVIDVLVEGDDCSIVSEFVPGYSLRDVLDRLRSCDNSLPVWFAVYVARKMSDALVHAHRGGASYRDSESIYHQDVSAENVLVTDSGQVLLVDFGLSRSALLGIEASGTRRWSDSGEFDLWAPHYGDAQSDLLGLGRVFYELLAGKAPGKRFAPPSQYAAWVPVELDQLLKRMLTTRTSERFASMSDVSEALDCLASRQRQSVDATHLSGLLRVVMSSFPSVPRAALPTPVLDAEGTVRSNTILPAAIIDIAGAQDESSRPNDRPPSVAPGSGRVSHHDWDAAVDSVRRGSLNLGAVVDRPEKCATESFERGLEQLRLGDLQGAEIAWLRALELDPNHRLCQVNLKLLRKRRDSDRPQAAQ